jgi:hypothetical protein
MPDERAANSERNNEAERASRPESTIQRERARGCESTVTAERAAERERARMIEFPRNSGRRAWYRPAEAKLMRRLPEHEARLIHELKVEFPGSVLR